MICIGLVYVLFLQHVEEISTMSIDLLSAIKQVKNPRCPENNIQIRIGIHTGKFNRQIVRYQINEEPTLSGNDMQIRIGIHTGRFNRQTVRYQINEEPTLSGNIMQIRIGIHNGRFNRQTVLYQINEEPTLSGEEYTDPDRNTHW